MYDPVIGRFLEEDPIEFDANDPNLFRYVGNSPTNFTDPSGMQQFGRPRETRLTPGGNPTDTVSPEHQDAYDLWVDEKTNFEWLRSQYRNWQFGIARTKWLKDYKHNGHNETLYNEDEDYRSLVDAIEAVNDELETPKYVGPKPGPNGSPEHFLLPAGNETVPAFFPTQRIDRRTGEWTVDYTPELPRALSQETLNTIFRVKGDLDFAATRMHKPDRGPFANELVIGAGESVLDMLEGIANIDELLAGIKKVCTSEEARTKVAEAFRERLKDLRKGDPRAIGKTAVDVVALKGAGKGAVQLGKISAALTVTTAKALWKAGLRGKELATTLLKAERVKTDWLAKVDPEVWRGPGGKPGSPWDAPQSNMAKRPGKPNGNGEINGSSRKPTAPVEPKLTEVSGPYSHLSDGTKIEPGRKFQDHQRDKILAENQKNNNNKLRSDDPNDPWYGKDLEGPGPRRFAGDTVPPNEAQIDHIIPRIGPDGKPLGTNAYSNARVISAEYNNMLRNKKPQSP